MVLEVLFERSSPDGVGEQPAEAQRYRQNGHWQGRLGVRSYRWKRIQKQ